MLPKPKNTPSALFQALGHLGIAGLISRNFGVPELLPRLRPAKVLRAAVPEAAIDENGDLLRPEDEIRAHGFPDGRFAGARVANRDLPAPSGDALRTKHGAQPQLGVLVATRADAAHDLAALGFGKDVGHGTGLISEPEG